LPTSSVIMRAYEYPRVPRASQLSVDTGNRSTVRDSTFSWVGAETEARLEQGNHEPQPPVPQIPRELTPQPAYIRTTDVPAYTSQDNLTQGPDPQIGEDMKHTYIPGQPMPTQHEVQQVQYAATTTDPTQQYQQPFHQPPEPDPPKSNSLTPTTPSRAHIEPDANPLRTPVSPRSPGHLPRGDTNTNIPVLPPHDTYSSSTYAPHPQPRHGGSFTHSFFSCSHPSICIPSLFCPCIVYGRTQYRLTQRSNKADPTNMLGYNSVNGSCVAFGVLCGINGILSAIQHTRVRRAYAMEGEAGNVFVDCIKGCCCCCCVVAQDEKEVKVREEEARKPGGRGKEGYVAVGNMAYGGQGGMGR
jgi:Cys-rich protein (TIGR01571 family)